MQEKEISCLWFIKKKKKKRSLKIHGFSPWATAIARTALHRLQLPYRGVLHGLQVIICSSVVLHWAAAGQPASPWTSPQAAGETTLQCLEHLLPLLLHWPQCLQGCSSQTFLTAAAQQFLPFLKYAVTEAPPASLMGSALGSVGSILEPAALVLSSTWAAPGLLLQRSALQPPHYENLAK